MTSNILESILCLRNGRPLSVDQRNSNRYRIVFMENNGSQTGYYFSTPIYNEKSRKLLDGSFHQNGSAIYTVGSNSDITIGDNVRIENALGYCSVSLSGSAALISRHHVRTSAEDLCATTNGIAYLVKCSRDFPYQLTLTVGQPFLQIRENGKYFTLMSEEFKPFVCVSCIGSVDGSGRVIAPAEIIYRKINDRMYDLFIRPQNPLEQFVLFEVNLYEPKLFQDTTVESGHPDLNNAFGGMAFVGNTEGYGEQWLYTRPDFSKMTEMLDRQILKAVLYLPKLSRGNALLSAYGVSARFCSFGSNWNNKIPLSAVEISLRERDDYAELDITPLLREQRTGYMKRSEGLILRTTVKGSGFSAIATGDNYYAPQILEINFR